MRKIYALMSLATFCASAGATSTEGRINLKDRVVVHTQSEKGVEVLSSSDQTIIPLRVPQPKKAAVERKSLVLYEDFSMIPEGDTETIGKMGERYVDYVASRQVAPGRYIDNEYTPESGTWEGDFVFAGKGGNVVLQCYNPYVGATLNTPLGDYSGDLTVTVRARWSKPFIGADTETGYVTMSSSDLSCSVRRYGYDTNTYDSFSDTDITGFAKISSGQIYKADGWQEITYTFRNMSANNDGYLSFSTAGAIEIDWIKVEDNNTFLACPVMNEATNFTNDGFTINWDQVRRSANYYIDLWKTVYTADKGIDESCDFEDGSIPEWLSGSHATFADGEGNNGSTAFVLADGEENALSTIDMGMKLDSFTSQVKFQLNDEESIITLYYDVLGENGWQPLGYLDCDYVMVWPGYFYTVQLDGSLFEGLYSAVRVYAEGTTEDNKVFIDDMSVYAKRPYELERVKGDYGAVYYPNDDDNSYNYYTHTSNSDPQVTEERCTSYTFVGLDPEVEYWYRVRSHNVSEFSIGEKHHAFGVAAPELLSATNVSNSSYTANWIDAPKAQKYIVTNYSGEKVDTDDSQYTLMLETLGKCNNGETEINFMEAVGNETECFLDDYTDLKGWRGSNIYVGQNMIGGIDYSRTYLITPPIMCNPERGKLLVYLEFIGYTGDYLHITFLKSGMVGDIPFDEEGMCSGWVEIPAVEGEQLKFVSYNGVSFAMCAFEAMQAVEAGDIIRRFDCSVEVPAGEQAYTFSNLSSEINSYSVVSSFTLEKENTLSTSDKFVTVDLGSGESKVTSKIDVIDSNLEEVSRYSISGVKVNKDYKGVVIVKMNDGSVSKKVVK